jgi:hypothetical protein
MRYQVAFQAGCLNDNFSEYIFWKHKGNCFFTMYLFI